MNRQGLERAALLLLIFLIVLIVVGVVIGSGAEVSQKGVEVPLGQCYAPPEGDGVTFCNIMWAKNHTYVTVYSNDRGKDLLIIFTFQTVESRGYSVMSGGLSIYIEPVAR